MDSAGEAVVASKTPQKAHGVAGLALGELPGCRKPDYRKMAHELAQLGAEAANRARATGNGNYASLARTLTSRAGEILNDLDRGGAA